MLSNIAFITICMYLLINIYASFPIDIKNTSRAAIKHGELLPPDHVPGAHVEQDGHINKDYHHEVFLDRMSFLPSNLIEEISTDTEPLAQIPKAFNQYGKAEKNNLGELLKDGTLDWSNMEGYKKLIKTFHLVDTGEDHAIDHDELKTWIHLKILDHYNNAENESNHVFQIVDHDGDDLVSWPVYKAQLLGLDPGKYEHENSTIEADKNGELSKEVGHWLGADENSDGMLNRHEFLAFLHPEHNLRTIKIMSEDMIKGYDKNKDGNLSLEEFIALPPGEVDPEEEELDRLYQQERAEEFKRDMDSNSDNIVTLKEMMSYLDPRHMQHAIKEAEYLIRNSDRNMDKKITEHEMLMQYKLFTGSAFSNFAKVLHDEF